MGVHDEHTHAVQRPHRCCRRGAELAPVERFRRGRDRQFHREARPGALTLAVSFDRPRMHFHQVTDDGEAESESGLP
jgi:hypothetical protein